MPHRPPLVALPGGSGLLAPGEPVASDTETQLRHLLCDVLGRSEEFFYGLMSEFRAIPDEKRDRAIRAAIEFYSQRAK